MRERWSHRLLRDRNVGIWLLLLHGNYWSSDVLDESFQAVRHNQKLLCDSQNTEIYDKYVLTNCLKSMFEVLGRRRRRTKSTVKSWLLWVAHLIVHDRR
jgi:hypothetical protein